MAHAIRPGRKPRVLNMPATSRIELRLTAVERAELNAVARENDVTMAEVIREAVNEFVADYRERHVFHRPGAPEINSVR